MQRNKTHIAELTSHDLHGHHGEMLTASGLPIQSQVHGGNQCAGVRHEYTNTYTTKDGQYSCTDYMVRGPVYDASVCTNCVPR